MEQLLNNYEPGGWVDSDKDWPSIKLWIIEGL